jgi:hypothetical protein
VFGGEACRCVYVCVRVCRRAQARRSVSSPPPGARCEGSQCTRPKRAGSADQRLGGAAALVLDRRPLRAGDHAAGNAPPLASLARNGRSRRNRSPPPPSLAFVFFSPRGALLSLRCKFARQPCLAWPVRALARARALLCTKLDSTV